MSGELYEMKMTAVLFCRAMRSKNKFTIASNMAAADSFDDIVVMLPTQGTSVFMQLKHRANNSDIKESQLLQLKGDFSLLQYFKAYVTVGQKWAKDKSLRKCGRFEDAIFVVYSNAKLNITCDSAPDEENLLTFLGTGGKCMHFTKDSHTKIWKLFENLEHYIQTVSKAVEGIEPQDETELLEIVNLLWNNSLKNVPEKQELEKFFKELQKLKNLGDHKKFLSQFLFFHGHVNEYKLDKSFRQEIQQLLGSDVQYVQLLAEFQNWWRKSDIFLTENTPFWQNIVASCITDISKHKRKELEDINIKFENNVIDKLKENLPKDGELLHIVTNGEPDNVTLNTLKLCQSISCDQQYLLVDGSCLKARQDEVQSLWGNSCDLLIIVEDGNTPDEYLRCHPEKKLVYISKSAPNGDHSTLEGYESFMEFDEQSRRRVMDATVSFQGYDVPLGDIVGTHEEYVPSDSVIQLLTGNVLLGDELCGDDDYYIARSMQISLFIEDNIMSHQNGGPITLAVSGKMNTVAVAEMIEIIPIEVKDEFLKLAESKKCVHWLHSVENGFQWIQSKGDMTFLREYIKPESVRFRNVNCTEDIPYRVCVVSAEPGMGKSTLLTHLALGTKKKSTATWVQRVNLNHHTDFLQKLSKQMTLQVVLDFLLKISKIPTEWRPLFHVKLMHMEKICILFDAYDEISPTHADKVATMLSLLQKTNVESLWVTTRPNMRVKLEDKLSTLALTLDPFSVEEQQHFLAKFWKKSVPDMSRSSLNDFIKQLLDETEKNLNDTDNKFTSNPLLAKLLADVFESDLKKFYATNEVTSEVKLHQKFDLLYIYDTSVDLKFEIYYEKNNLDMTKPGVKEDYEQIKRKLKQDHMISALAVILSEKVIEDFQCREYLKMNHFKDFLMKIQEGKIKIGLIKEVTGNKPVFLHRTFAEYFAGMWLAENCKRAGIRKYLKANIFNANMKMVRQFFDRILAKKFEIHTAVWNNNTLAVEKLLATDESIVNRRDDGGRTPLHHAIIGIDRNENTLKTMVKTLLDNGVHPFYKDNVMQWTPLRFADKMQVPLSVVDLLLETHYIKPTLEVQMDEDNQQMVLESVKEDLVFTTRSIKNRKQLDKMLGKACREGLCYVIAYILENNVFVKHQITVENGKATMLHIAAGNGHLKLVEYLVDLKADLEAQDTREGRTPIMWAAEGGHFHVVKFLIKKGVKILTVDKTGINANLLAAQNNSWDTVQLLIQDSDTTVCDQSGNNVLHCASWFGASETVAMLLDKGADIECQNKKKYTPLLLAIREDKVDVVKLLVQRGANFKVHGSHGNNILHTAAKKGSRETMKYLISIAVDLVETKNHFFDTPIIIAAKDKNWDVVKLLLNYTDVRTCEATIFELCLKYGVDKMIPHLLDSGANINSCDENNRTLVYRACNLGKLQIVELLCQRGADLHKKDNQGFTPLHVAVTKGNLQIVECLLKHGANVSLCNNAGLTALDIARTHHGTDIVNCLQAVASGTAE